jgi:hypothetical protein
MDRYEEEVWLRSDLRENEIEEMIIPFDSEQLEVTELEKGFLRD